VFGSPQLSRVGQKRWRKKWVGHGNDWVGHKDEWVGHGNDWVGHKDEWVGHGNDW
jgi:hypothetical protein